MRCVSVQSFVASLISKELFLTSIDLNKHKSPFSYLCDENPVGISLKSFL